MTIFSYWLYFKKVQLVYFDILKVYFYNCYQIDIFQISDYITIYRRSKFSIKSEFQNGLPKWKSHSFTVIIYNNFNLNNKFKVNNIGYVNYTNL